MKTYVVGHKNPDTDSIISAISIAKYLGDSYLPARVGELNKETAYILSRFNLDAPVELPEDASRIVLVDHNSPDEASEIVTPEKITAIYDHHRIGGAYTSDPVPARFETVGSTCTIAAQLFQEGKMDFSKDLAAAMICGILSDTLNFTSPTTTDTDKEVVNWLNEHAGIDIEKTAEAMFMAKSDISGIKTADLLTKDYKVFEMSGQKVGVGVWETVLPEAVLAREKEIMEALVAEKAKSKLDYIYFAVVDIMKQTAHFVLLSEKETEVAESIFKTTAADGILVANGVVSRKKQMIPQLEKYFA